MVFPPPLRLEHIDFPGVRPKMLQLWTAECEALAASGRPRPQWPFGAFLTPAGWDAYLRLMPLALELHEMDWLAEQMSNEAYWLTTYIQSRRRGPTRARVPQPNALVRLAFGEFNTAYVRAVATLALVAGIPTCVILRAAPASAPRDACTYMEGASVSCEAIVDGHRAYDRGGGVEISIPAGPNCHHTIQIAQWSQASRDA